MTVRPDGVGRVVGDADTTAVAAGRSWRVAAGGFWQVHPGAADVFVDALLEFLQPRAGERLADLYAGVGLFAGALLDRCSLAGALCVESSPAAAEAARGNLADLPVEVMTADVEGWLAGGGLDHPGAGAGPVDLVVLDPPRRGAGEPVVDAICRARPRAVGYVACDPSALGRDVAHFARRGYAVGRVRAFDAFPMTAHVETIALLEPVPHP